MRLDSSSVVVDRGVAGTVAMAALAAVFALLGVGCGQKGPLIAERPVVAASAALAAMPASAAAGTKVVPPSAPP